jgi:hypothetical protein
MIAIRVLFIVVVAFASLFGCSNTESPREKAYPVQFKLERNDIRPDNRSEAIEARSQYDVPVDSIHLLKVTSLDNNHAFPTWVLHFTIRECILTIPSQFLVSAMSASLSSIPESKRHDSFFPQDIPGNVIRVGNLIENHDIVGGCRHYAGALKLYDPGAYTVSVILQVLYPKPYPKP